MPRPTPEDDLLDLPALLADAAVAAVTVQQPAPFLDWLRANLVQYAAPGSQLEHDEELRRAFTTALGRALWNAMPLPRRGFLTEPIPEPGRNEPCACGSGRKFKHCCARAPSLGPFTAPLMWPYVLRALSDPAREAALRSSHLPREAVLQYASDKVEDDPETAVELLEPMLAEPVTHEDDLAAHALDLLCNAYDARGNAKRRKAALLERIATRASRSPLRSAAHQRLACILMDRGRARAAWAAFRSAQQDDPGNPALGLLEVQLLLGEGRSDEARERARFFQRQLRRSGADLDPGMLEFFERIAADPGRAMSDVAFDIEQGAGRRLADWLDRVRSRPLPAYVLARPDEGAGPTGPETLAERLRQMGVTESQIEGAVADMQRQIAELEHLAPDAEPDDEAPRPQDEEPALVLVAPATLAAIEERWRTVFPLDKPFSVHPLPWGDTDPWAPGVESQWMEALERHPEAFDSLDVLDDLATATMTHGQSGQPAVIDRLSRPLLERSAAILERALADARPAVPPARMPWAMTGNRPALRSLFRLHEIAMQTGRDGDARRFAERLIAINPDDNHGVRCWLAGAYLKADDADACLRLVEAYPDDGSPELRFDAALALYRLGRARSATEALQSAHREMPRVTRYLLEKRIARPKLSEHGVSFDGDDRGWLYREDMRSTWAATPGALKWATKVLRG